MHSKLKLLEKDNKNLRLKISDISNQKYNKFDDIDNDRVFVSHDSDIQSVERTIIRDTNDISHINHINSRNNLSQNSHINSTFEKSLMLNNKSSHIL